MKANYFISPQKNWKVKSEEWKVKNTCHSSLIINLSFASSITYWLSKHPLTYPAVGTRWLSLYISFEATDTQYISIRANRRNYRIPHSDILYIEALKDYVIIHTFTDRYITWINLKNIHSQLPSALFLRANKSCVVNVQHISSYTHQFVYIGETEIPIGRAYQEDFFSTLTPIH